MSKANRFSISESSRRLAFALLAGAAIGSTHTASAQYTITGTTPGGGNIIVGSGNLGALTPTSSPALSAAGSDDVTISIGAVAASGTSDTIAFTTSNNILLNNGSILGQGGNAVSFFDSTSGLTNELVTNNGAISGNNPSASGTAGADSTTGFAGRGGDAAAGTVGIYAASSLSISNFSITNNGGITGGNATGNGGLGGSINSSSGYGAGQGGAGASGGWGVAFLSGGILANTTITNTGSILGGNASGNGGLGGSVTGLGYAGAGGSGGAGGYAILGEANSVNTFTLVNAGSIIGGSGAGSGGKGGDLTGDGNAGVGGPGGQGAFAVAISGAGVSGVTITNTGSIIGGNGSGDGGAGGSVSSSTTQTFAGNAGNGASGVSAIIIGSSASLDHTTIINNGSITGGSGTGDGGNGGSIAGIQAMGDAGAGGGAAAGGGAVQLIAQQDVSNTLFVNNGIMTGGNGTGNGGNGGHNAGSGFGGYGGNGGGAGDALFVESLSSVVNLSLINNGTLMGGTGIGNGGSGADTVGAIANPNDGGYAATGGDGITMLVASEIANVSIVNHGVIIAGGGFGNGGNGGIGGTGRALGGAGGQGGAGISFFSQKYTNVSVTNYGSIFGGDGAGTPGLGAAFSPAPPASGGAGIKIRGGNNGVSGFTITNYGFITGGNGLSGANAGAGINTVADNIVINNYGAISAGSGANPQAVIFGGGGDILNVNGHATVNGLIVGAGLNDVLNFNLTGLSPADIASIHAQLAAQGITSGTASSGVISVRGATYQWDPLFVNLNLSSYQLQGLTPNQQAIGASLDSAIVNPAPGSALFTLFNAIDASGNVPAALQALSPQGYQAYGDLAIQNSTAMVQSVDDRLNNLRDGSENIDTTGLGGTVDTVDKTTSGYSKDGKDAKSVVTTPAPERRWGFFAAGQGMFFRGSAKDVDATGAKSNTAGAIAGVDGKVGEHGNIGAFFAYDNADATLNNGGGAFNAIGATIESYSGGIYGAYHQDGFFVNALGAYTHNDYTSSRSISFPGFLGTANGSTHGNQYTGNIDGGYDWHATQRLTAGPLVGVQYVHLDVDGFNESGSPAALGIGSQSMDSLESRIGGRLNYHILDNRDMTFAADMHAAWQHEYLNDSRAITASFAGGSLTPFSVQTSSPRRDSAVVGAGVNCTFKDRLTLFAAYELQIWDTSTYQQTVNGGFRLSF